MMRLLRRSSKDPVVDDLAKASDNETAAPMEDNAGTSTRLSFFDLPPELRNEIYEHVISDTTLSLPSKIFATSRKPRLPLKKRKSVTPPINGLLLASRQCHREYLSLLLSTVLVIVEIKDFDFEHVMRVSSSLSAVEAEALRSNNNLLLYLNTRNCTSKDLASLRRWLDFRQNRDSTGLPWKYQFPLAKHLPPTDMGKVRLCRELEYYADTIHTLAVDLRTEQQEELQAIIDAFESKALWLEEDVGWLSHRSKSASREVRGLAGGGLH